MYDVSMKVLYKAKTKVDILTDYGYVFVQPTIDVISPFRKQELSQYHLSSRHFYKGYELAHFLKKVNEGHLVAIDILMNHNDPKVDLVDKELEYDASFVDEIKMAGLASLDAEKILKSYVQTADELKNKSLYADALISLARAQQLLKYGAYLPDPDTYAYSDYIRSIGQGFKADRGYNIRFNKLVRSLNDLVEDSPVKPNLDLVENTIMIIRRHYWKLKPLADKNV